MGRVALICLALLLAGCGLGRDERQDASRQSPAPSPTPTATATATPDPLPDPRARLPTGPERLAARLDDTSRALDEAIDRWREEGDPRRGGPPDDVALLAYDQQRIYRLLGDRPRLYRAVLRRARIASRKAEIRDYVVARRALASIVSVKRGPTPEVRIGSAEPADVLRDHYSRAFRRFQVGPPLLAAVNFVESAFGRLRNRSISGAQGPMQFIPSTWRAYGLGGDIRDPRDAILGAANYLRASGAPGDERRALFAYNPSRAYVEAISRYARRIRADERAFYAFYAWAVIYRGQRRTPLPTVPAG